MELFYFKGRHPNVGDDFNGNLWPLVWPGLAEERRWNYLIGIGTIIDDRLDALPGRKLVAGSGVRPMGRAASRETLDFAWVRGRLSAAELQLSVELALGDPGFLAPRFFPLPRAPKPGRIGLIPHYHTEVRTHLFRYLGTEGIDIISPRIAPAAFFARLLACEAVFCEAMHGAIFAQAYGVPWARVRLHSHVSEGPTVSTFKWEDTFSVLPALTHFRHAPTFNVRSHLKEKAGKAHASAWWQARKLRTWLREQSRPELVAADATSEVANRIAAKLLSLQESI